MSPEEKNPEELTAGEKAMGVTFNPSNNWEITILKAKFAGLYTQLHFLRDNTDNWEKKRMFSVAMTELQTAQVWAVKALTWKD